MKVLITGGAGFIGSYLSEAYIELNHEVYVIDDLSTGRLENIKHLLKNPGFHFINDTVLNRDAMLELTGICDVVVVTRPPSPARLAPEEIPVAAREAFWYDPASESFRHRSGHVLTLQRITALDISAAAIRARLVAGRSIRFLVPPAVETYIVEHGLYRQGDASR